MNATERNKIADDLFAELARTTSGSTEDKIAVAAVLAAKVVASATSDSRNRSATVRSLTMIMTAQLTLETAGEHRALQPIGRMGTGEDDD